MMKMTKLVAVVELVGAITLVGCGAAKANVHELTVTDGVKYRNMVKNTSAVQVYNSEDLTSEILERRNGKVIVEKCVGHVDDAKGNGHELVTGGYISYRSVKGAKKGDVIVTYLTYNSETNYVDDIIARTDYIVDVNQ